MMMMYYCPKDEVFTIGIMWHYVTDVPSSFGLCDKSIKLLS